ncbi:GNAT family N-acetyltransferase [Sungkyunkwania multivorans]|uniref:GNAT family N-acetyltransferase n=1 Tax=Sungkyunkwania multivorans TaxID=1173618 RepID=A0ABW3CXC1_9FLAO
MKILFAAEEHLDALIPLFDGYRVFYKQKSDPEGAKRFLRERLALKEATILLALKDDETPIGFIQLFPIFSSVTMERMYLLNDLFVAKEERCKGVGQALLNAAKELCVKKNYKGLALQTEVDNPAQKLYEYLGWVRDPDLHYFWKARY